MKSFQHHPNVAACGGASHPASQALDDTNHQSEIANDGAPAPNLPEAFDDHDDHLLLLPARVLGFCLATKAWTQFSVDQIEPVVRDTDIYKQLVFPQGVGIEYKGLENMVISHFRLMEGTNGVDNPLKDLIAGKGDGLVFLFHGTVILAFRSQPSLSLTEVGPTGVGKTLTAEVLAKSSGFPLYKVKFSEIGLKSQDAEVALRRLFEIAGAWNAILLM